MEYSVPAEAGADCLREILRTVIEKEVDVVFPLEYRYVKRDDTWLSMSAGDGVADARGLSGAAARPGRAAVSSLSVRERREVRS